MRAQYVPRVVVVLDDDDDDDDETDDDDDDETNVAVISRSPGVRSPLPPRRADTARHRVRRSHGRTLAGAAPCACAGVLGGRPEGTTGADQSFCELGSSFARLRQAWQRPSRLAST
jgi:hypothetical protein